MSLEQDTSIGSVNVDEVLGKRAKDLCTSITGAGKSLAEGNGAKWFQLYSDGSKVLDGIAKEDKNANFLAAFDRAKLNQGYVDAVVAKSGVKSYRLAQFSKVQLDLLAAMERETRMRYRSRVRMIAHAAARLQSQGLGDGPINSGIINFVTRLADRK